MSDDSAQTAVEKALHEPQSWACPFAGCGFEGTVYDRVPHLLGHD